MQNILASEIWASIESKIFKSRFLFSLLLLSSSFIYLALFLVPFGWAFSRLHFSWKCFWESFSNLRIWCKERKVGSGTGFSWRFSGQHCIFFFAFFLGLLDWIWYSLKDLFPLHKVNEQVFLDHLNQWLNKQYKDHGSTQAVTCISGVNGLMPCCFW